MQFMDLFELTGVPAPVVEKSDESKRKVSEKKSKSVAIKPIKNTIKLPMMAYIQGYSSVALTSNLFNDKLEVTDVEIKDYLNKVCVLPDSINFSFEKDGVYVGFSDNTPTKIGEITIPEGAIAWFGSFSQDLSEIVGKIAVKDLAEYLINVGLPLGNAENVKVILVDSGRVVIPVPEKANYAEFKKLTLPLTVRIYGSWEDVVISAPASIPDDESEFSENDISEAGVGAEISEQMIVDAVTAKYPEFKNRCVLCALDAESGVVHCYLNAQSHNSSKKHKEETFKINNDTSFRFYAVNVDIHLEEGEYTLKSICKAAAKAGIPECNAPDTIMAKQVGNLICLAVKFGGSKGAISDICTFPPYSVKELVLADGTYCNVRPCWLYREGADGTKSFGLRIPKIPKEIYDKVASLFAKFSRLDVECLARIYWNPQVEQYVVRVPDQHISIESVIPEEECSSDFLFEHIPFLEVHSHGRVFDAFFSSTDDASECNKYALYGVFSFNEDGSVRNSKFRCCCGAGRQILLSASDLFDGINCDSASYCYDENFVSDAISRTHFTIMHR